MSELPEKQAKRLKSLLQEAETNLAAAKGGNRFEFINNKFEKVSNQSKDK